MCGIGAFIAPGSEADQATAVLRTLAGCLAHRGPDDEGIECFEAAGASGGLCVRRLAIRDRSTAGHQPMRLERSGRMIAFNGEIYNAEELRDALRGRGYTFQGRSDTEVTLAAYDAWGPTAFNRLRGMFALAIWDAPAQRLVLARDPLGIKPLYYGTPWGGAGGLVVASELRALLATGLVPRRVDRAGLASYLTLGAVVAPGTIVEGIRMLPPGEYATWTDGQLVTTRYWSLATAFAAPSQAASRVDAVTGVRERLADSVRSHLVADVPVGVFLSGGVDSSAIAALAAQRSGSRLVTVSAILPEQGRAETDHIRRLVTMLGSDHHEVPITPAGMEQQVQAGIEAADQPTMDGVNTYIVSAAARQAGLTVALSGLGADEIFGGYSTFRRAPWLHRAQVLLPGIAGRGAGAAIGLALGDRDRAERLRRWLERGPGTERAVPFQRELFSPSMRASLIGPGEVAPALCPPYGRDRFNETSACEIAFYMQHMLLRDTDVMSMAHGLEVRVPFVDRHVVEYVASLPGAWKRGGRRPKPLLADAMEDLLPPEILAQRKTGFALPFAHALFGSLGDAVERRLLDPGYGGEIAEALNPEAVAAVWRRFRAGRTHWTRPWALYALKSWGAQHL